MTGQGLRIRVRGQVQGVGFRPFVWQLAARFGVRGRVLNDAEGVLIWAVGGDLDGFLTAIRQQPPKLARVDTVEVTPAAVTAQGFAIAESGAPGAQTRVTPDAASCPDCVAEIFGSGRRAGYAFTNCTHCGPRFTILKALPYDRAQTVMAGFALCADCRAEYDDPADRRFHAQPVACPACGPRLWLEVGGTEVPGDPVTLAAARLRAGEVLAVKGLGGFHLAVDAANPAALALLRARKHRPAKPFALMGTGPMLARIAHLSPAVLARLRDPAAPVVLADSRGALPEAVAPGMASLGVMLPYTPLHHLLLAAFGDVLVMTSGNLSGEPQVIGNAEAREKLAGFADAFLMHDRDIARRLDDGVERADPPMVLRRARGRVPGTLRLPPGLADAPQVLALGGQIKGAICLTRDGQAMLSHHLGDLDGALNRAEFHRAIADLTELFDHRPARVAVDLHEGYAATQAGRAMADAAGLPLVAVQHHHAHLAACLGENLWPLDGGPVAGIVLDGTGLGSDGTIWGGEVLLGDYHHVQRIAHLAPAPLPGGDLAARDPWRNLLVRLDQAGLHALADEMLRDHPRAVIRAAIRAGVNAPLSSSVGRLFDAVAAMLNLCPRQTHEGEAAMRLEALAARASPDEAAFFYDVHMRDGVLEPAGLWPLIRRDLADGVAPEAIALRFHSGLARAFSGPARAAVESGRARAVALSGGCFQNAVLLTQMRAWLGDVTVLTHRDTPAGDGGLALGQALVAAASD